MSARKRVCHIAATNDGATWMLEQLRELRDRKGYDVSAIVANGDGKLTQKLRAEGIPYHAFDFEFPSARGWISLLDRVVLLARLLRRERYDVVQTHLFASMVLGRLAAWLADCPVRLAMIAGPFHLEAYTPRWIDGSTCWMETGLIGSCEYTRTLYQGLRVSPRRISVIFYGPDETKFAASQIVSVDLRREFDLPNDAPLVGMVAYFYPRLPANRWIPEFLHDRANKRQEDLIAAFPQVLRRFPDAQLFLVGSGWGEAGEVELEKARAQVQALGIADHVVFTGYRTDVNGILASLDVSVQGALSENLGGTIESLLMERPTVATRTGGLVDSIRDGETGILVAPSDPASMAQGIIRLLEDPEAAKRMAQNGRQLMLREFTLSKTVDDLDELYRQQMSRGWFGKVSGYRLPVTALRALMAVWVFGYLAARLAYDTKIGARWDTGWRPFPIPQYRRTRQSFHNRRMAAAAGLAAAARFARQASLNGGEATAAWLASARTHLSPSAIARSTLLWFHRSREAVRLWLSNERLSPAALLRSVLHNLKRVVQAGVASIRGAAHALRTAFNSILVATSGNVRRIAHDCERRHFRRVVFGANRRRRTWAWLKRQPLFAYGYVRYLLRGKPVLRRWDVFFARVRGHPPYTEAELDAIHGPTPITTQSPPKP
jgi:glycosyltransferase involved in cell wall biosynthesis